LWDYANEKGERAIFEPLAHELRRQQRLFAQMGVEMRQSGTPNGKSAGVWLSSKKRPILCLFTDSHEPSGIGEYMLTLATELLKQYYILFVCPPTASGRQVLERAKATGCVVLALDVRGRGPDWDHLCYWLRNLSVDIFHSHADMGWEGHDGVYAAREAGVPVVLRTEHLPYPLADYHQRLAHQYLLQAVDRLICVPEEARRMAQEITAVYEELRS
jgi:hypothetical protein